MSGFLEHHGVKGMRWGVRKAHSSTRAQKARAKASYQRSDKLKGRLQKPGLSKLLDAKVLGKEDTAILTAVISQLNVGKRPMRDVEKSVQADDRRRLDEDLQEATTSLQRLRGISSQMSPQARYDSLIELDIADMEDWQLEIATEMNIIDASTGSQEVTYG